MSEDATVAEVVEETEVAEADAEVTEVEETPETEVAEQEAEPSESSTEKIDKAQAAIDKRIGEITRQAKEAQRDRDYWKNLAQQERVAPVPVEPGKTLADFEYDEGKFATYLTEQAKADAQAVVETRLVQERQARAQADFSSREADFSRDIDDYHTVTRSNDLKITGEMVQVLQEAEKGPEVLYHLGKNPEIAEKLANMSPLQMAREIGRIEASTLVKPVSVTKAPAPVPKISGVEKSTTVKADSPDSDKLSTEEWLKRRNKQIAR